MADKTVRSQEASDGDPILSTSRRTVLKAFAGASAAVLLSSKVAWANGEIGFWAKDLSDEKLTEMYSTILRIRWHERTMVDKMLTEAGF